MKHKRRLTLMAALRAEMAYFATLCVMVLAIPLLLPVAQAHAFLSGLVVCSQDGVSAAPGAPEPRLVHEDCPCVVPCNGSAGKMVKALQTLLPTEAALPAPATGWKLTTAPALSGDDVPAGDNAIRAPPLPV